MVNTKQTCCGGSSQHPKGMASATFAKADPEQSQGLTSRDTEDSQDWPDPEVALTRQGTASTSKSEGKPGNPTKEAEGGAEAPPEEIPPAPEPTNMKPGTSMDPTDAPTEAPTRDPSQPALQNPDEENPPDLTDYVKDYKKAGKVWLDTVLEKDEETYTMLFNTLQQLGDPHINYFEEANKKQAFKCIRDRTGRYLSKDEFATHIEKEEVGKQPQHRFTGEAKEAMKDYYDVVHMLIQAQANFASSTQVLEKKITDKSVFLDIIRQTQLPALQVSDTTVEKQDKLEGKTFRELTLLCHLPNFRRIFPNCMVSLSVFAGSERVLRRFSVFAEEPHKSTINH